MAGADFTAVSAALKEHYAKNVAKVLFDDPNVTPLLGILEKRSGKVDAGGRKFVQAIQYSDGTSVSADFATAQAKAESTTTGASNAYSRWEVDAVTVNAVAYWDRRVIDNVQGDSAMFDLAQAEMDSKMRLIRLDLAKHLAGTGYGALAGIRGITDNTTAGTCVITVGSDKVNRFVVGQDLVASSADSGAALRSATSASITGIDPDGPTIMMDTACVASLSWASSSSAGDYLFAKGDRVNSTALTMQKLWGFGGWLPTSAPGTTTFGGVNRSGSWQLGGLRYNATSKAGKTALITGANKLYQFGAGRATHAFLSVNDYASLTDTLDSAGRTIKIDARDFKIAFDGIEVLGSNGGAIKVTCDPWIPDGEVIMGDFTNGDNAYLIYSGDLVNIDDHDGNIFLRAASATAYEARMYSYCNLVVAAPGKFIKIINFLK